MVLEFDIAAEGSELDKGESLAAGPYAVVTYAMNADCAVIASRCDDLTLPASQIIVNLTSGDSYGSEHPCPEQCTLGGSCRPAEEPPSCNAGERWIQASAGDGYTCGIYRCGVYCWGDAQLGQLGSTSADGSVQRVPLEEEAVEVHTGSNHACALTVSGNIYCWGDGFEGQLGLTPEDNGQPTLIEGLGTVRLFEVGTRHSCAVNDASELFCWGSNMHGQLGGTPATSGALVQVDLPDGEIEALALSKHSCATITSEGVTNAYCWGENGFGQAAPVAQDRLDTPTAVELPSGEDIVDPLLSASAGITCVKTNGNGNGPTAVCWGRDQGMDGEPAELPDLEDIPYSTLALGGDEGLITTLGCAVTPTQELTCFGPLPNELQISGARVNTSSAVLSVSVGTDHVCAFLMNGQLECWGQDGSGRPLPLREGEFAIPFPSASRAM